MGTKRSCFEFSVGVAILLLLSSCGGDAPVSLTVGLPTASIAYLVPATPGLAIDARGSAEFSVSYDDTVVDAQVKLSKVDKATVKKILVCPIPAIYDPTNELAPCFVIYDSAKTTPPDSGVFGATLAATNFLALPDLGVGSFKLATARLRHGGFVVQVITDSMVLAGPSGNIVLQASDPGAEPAVRSTCLIQSNDVQTYLKVGLHPAASVGPLRFALLKYSDDKVKDVSLCTLYDSADDDSFLVQIGEDRISHTAVPGLSTVSDVLTACLTGKCVIELIPADTKKAKVFMPVTYHSAS